MYSVSFVKFHFCSRTLVVGLGISFSEAGKPLRTLVLFDSNLVSLNRLVVELLLSGKRTPMRRCVKTRSECSRPCKNLF